VNSAEPLLTPEQDRAYIRSRRKAFARCCHAEARLHWRAAFECLRRGIVLYRSSRRRRRGARTGDIWQRWIARRDAAFNYFASVDAIRPVPRYVRLALLEHWRGWRKDGRFLQKGIS
jgi:hypothetical protein